MVDTGIGMLSDDLFRLFQPFIQVENASTRRSAGTGLGLVMVQKSSSCMVVLSTLKVS